MTKYIKILWWFRSTEHIYHLKMSHLPLSYHTPFHSRSWKLQHDICPCSLKNYSSSWLLLCCCSLALSAPSGQTHWNHNHRKLVNLITWTTALSNSLKLSHALWGHPRQAGHGGEIWQNVVTGEGNGKTLQYSCLENPMNSMKKQNDRILKEELPKSVGTQYTTGGQCRNNSRKNEGMEPKQKQYQLWMWLVIEARSNAVKSNIA